MQKQKGRWKGYRREKGFWKSRKISERNKNNRVNTADDNMSGSNIKMFIFGIMWIWETVNVSYYFQNWISDIEMF